MTRPSVLLIGEPIVAILPEQPVPVTASTRCRFSVGGAELNTAVALRRLGVDVHFVGRVGADLVGRMVLDHLGDEGIDPGTVVVDDTRPSACYVREWLPDGRRRISYHRSGSAGTALSIDDVVWPDREPDLVHVTGITLALGGTAAATVREVVARAGQRGIPVSFDPNHRPLLWSSDDARPVLADVAERSTIVLMSEDDRDVIHPGLADRDALAAALVGRTEIAVLKLGDRGAVAAAADGVVEQPAETVADPVDPVGAGDAFDAGFIAAHLRGAGPGQALRLGAHVAACVVRTAGDHDGAPRRADLPDDLR